MCIESHCIIGFFAVDNLGFLSGLIRNGVHFTPTPQHFSLFAEKQGTMTAFTVVGIMVIVIEMHPCLLPISQKLWQTP